MLLLTEVKVWRWRIGNRIEIKGERCKGKPGKSAGNGSFYHVYHKCVIVIASGIAFIPAGALGGSCQSGSDRDLYHNGADWRHSDGKKDQG